MNQFFAKWIACIFLFFVFIYNFTYIIANFNNRKVARKWIWFRAIFCFAALIGTLGAVYIFFTPFS